MTENNPNSRKIRIKRSGSFLSRSQGKEVDDYYSSSIQEIGSFFESSSAQRIASGLTLEEEKLLVPAVTGVPFGDKEFWPKRNNYYMTLFTKIPYRDGIELETGLKDNSQPVSDDNLPLNTNDYIRFRHHRVHPWVAGSESEARGNQLKHFYIEDNVLEAQSNTAANELRDKAMAEYLKIKSEPAKVDMMLTLLGIDPRDLIGQNDKHTNNLRQEKLRGLIDNSAKAIVDLSANKNFDILYKIRTMVNTGVLRVVNTKYLNAETGDTLGNFDEVLEFFKDEETNSAQIAVFSAKMQEALNSVKKVRNTIDAR